MESINRKTAPFVLPAGWLHGIRVLVIGCGGTGSEMVDALMRLNYVLEEMGGTGLSLTLVDGDKVSSSNVGRQRFLHCDVGSYKAEVLAKRYGFLYGHDIRYLNKYARNLRDLSDFDLVVTCIDRASFRVRIGKYWAKRDPSNTLWLDLGNGSHSGQVVLGHLTGRRGNEGLPNVCQLYPDLPNIDDDAEPSCSLEAALRSQRLGINRMLVDAAVFTLLCPLITQGSVKHHGSFIDLSKSSVRPLNIDADVWAFLGYREKAA